MTGTLEGHEDYYYNNKAVITGTDVGSLTCSGTGKTVVHDNEYYTPTGDITECQSSLADWQKAGNDKGSSVGEIPSDDTIIGWGRAALGV